MCLQQTTLVVKCSRYNENRNYDKPWTLWFVYHLISDCINPRLWLHHHLRFTFQFDLFWFSTIGILLSTMLSEHCSPHHYLNQRGQIMPTKWYWHPRIFWPQLNDNLSCPLSLRFKAPFSLHTIENWHMNVVIVFQRGKRLSKHLLKTCTSFSFTSWLLQLYAFFRYILSLKCAFALHCKLNWKSVGTAFLQCFSTFMNEDKVECKSLF